MKGHKSEHDPASFAGFAVPAACYSAAALFLPEAKWTRTGRWLDDGKTLVNNRGEVIFQLKRQEHGLS